MENELTIEIEKLRRVLIEFVGVVEDLGGTKVPEIIWRQMLKAQTPL